MWWTLHDVALAEVWNRLRRVQLAPFLAAVALATATFPLRTIRWQYLLRLEGIRLPFPPLWHATAIGFMTNNLLPARAGEFARAYSVSQLTPARFSTAFGSIAVERVLDGLTLVAFLAAAMWAGGFAPGTAVGSVTLVEIVQGAAAVFAGALVVALALVHWPGPAVRVTRRATALFLPTHWSERLTSLLEGALSGLDALRNPSRVLVAAFWSLIVWGVASASFWVAFFAFGIEVPISAAVLLQSIIAFGVALPSSPGFFGPFEAATRVSLALYGVAPGLAVSYAVGYHIATFFPITLLGIWSLGRAHLRLRELRAQT